MARCGGLWSEVGLRYVRKKEGAGVDFLRLCIWGCQSFDFVADEPYDC